ncbi:hypothetical protein FOPG_20183 [Fusarium oxysporum f. sp. conglutinans race 2 54008]|uniref:Uncharacterized protein n=1 Tax=Fusarium oxysporum f. sp. conglutinans race 2 54008 TaxID=1089457 RepID=X0GIS4_FUSOX|nr:hypothetical protein FOPG_20183 [Fusarium oxysporum f. sp. conglutinans race 2 54008]
MDRPRLLYILKTLKMADFGFRNQVSKRPTLPSVCTGYPSWYTAVRRRQNLGFPVVPPLLCQPSPPSTMPPFRSVPPSTAGVFQYPF